MGEAPILELDRLGYESHHCWSFSCVFVSGQDTHLAELLYGLEILFIKCLSRKKEISHHTNRELYDILWSV